MRNSTLLIFGAAAASLALFMQRQFMQRQYYHRKAGPLGPVHSGDHVRAAGTREMADPPRHWDIVDETIDESFPASDPPATY